MGPHACNAKDMLPISIAEIEQYKNDFTHYCPEIVEMVDRYIASEFLYNSQIASWCVEDTMQRFCDVTIKGIHHAVYCARQHIAIRDAKKALDEYMVQAAQDGYRTPDEEELADYAANRKFVMVQAFGTAPFKARPLIDPVDGRLLWMPPRNSRKGFAGFIYTKIQDL